LSLQCRRNQLKISRQGAARHEASLQGSHRARLAIPLSPNRAHSSWLNFPAAANVVLMHRLRTALPVRSLKGEPHAAAIRPTEAVPTPPTARQPQLLIPSRRREATPCSGGSTPSTCRRKIQQAISGALDPPSDPSTGMAFRVESNVLRSERCHPT